MGENVITRSDGGAEIVRTPEDAKLLGSRVVDPAVRDAGLRDDRRRSLFDGADDKVGAFVEGVVDALTLGFVQDHSDEGKLNRDVNAGWSTAGLALGTAGSLITGAGLPARVSRAAEGVGRAAAKTILRAGDDTIVGAASREAAAGAALSGATAFGHAVMDTLIEDKDFASEAILHDMKLGGVLSGVAGGVMGAFGKVARRSDVTGQGGLLGDPAPVARAIDGSIKAYDDALDHYAMQYGALKGLRDMDRLGPVSDGFMDVRSAALSKAQRLREHLRALDPADALSGVDDEALAAYRGAVKKYRDALRDVDDIMRPHRDEIVQAQDLGEPTRVELNPAGKVQGDLRDMAASMEQHEARALGDTPSSTAQTNPGHSPLMAAVDAAPATPHESAARVLDSLQTAKTVVDDIPLGMVEGRRARQGRAEPSMEARKAAKSASEDTMVDDLPLGAAEGAQARAMDTDRTGIAPARTQADIRVPDSFHIEDWFDSSKPGRVSPFHEAEARATSAMEGLRTGAGGRMESAAALRMVNKPAAADDHLGQYMDQVFSMRKAARMASDEARGVATPLRDAASNLLIGMAVDKLVGNKVAGFVAGFAGYGGRLAAASGRLVRKTSDAIAKFMTSTKVRAGTVAATNMAHAYSDKGPIEDPVERIQELKFLSANPDGVRQKVRDSAGDLAKVSPQLVRSLEDRAVAQVQRLAIRAPAIYFDKLGRPLSPPGGKMREFYEYENAMNDPEAILNGIASGSLTKPQAAALQDGWQSLHVKAASMFFQDPEKIQELDRAKLRVVEMVTGMSLTGATDPQFLMRQAIGWIPPAPPAPPGKPQAFNINPTGAPTPTQSNATGRAPGN
jgi:hypothetical protein